MWENHSHIQWSKSKHSQSKHKQLDLTEQSWKKIEKIMQYVWNRWGNNLKLLNQKLKIQQPEKPKKHEWNRNEKTKCLNIWKKGCLFCMEICDETAKYRRNLFFKYSSSFYFLPCFLMGCASQVKIKITFLKLSVWW